MKSIKYNWLITYKDQTTKIVTLTMIGRMKMKYRKDWHEICTIKLKPNEHENKILHK